MTVPAEGSAAIEVAPSESTVEQPAVEQPAVEQPAAEPSQFEGVERPDVAAPEPSTPREGQSAKTSAREAYLERVRSSEARQAQAAKAAEQPRDEQGNFVAGEEPAAVTDEEEDSPPAAEAAGEEEEAPTTEAATVAEGSGGEQTEEPEAAEPPQPDLVRIQLRDDHPLRVDQGVDFIDVLPEHERSVRTALNAVTRTREVEEANTRIEELEEQLVRLQAEMKADTNLRESLLRNPDVRNEYEAIYENAGEGAAERWLNGLKQEFKAQADKEVEDQLAERKSERLRLERHQAGLDFRANAEERLRKNYPEAIANHPKVWGPEGLLQQAFEAYGSYVAFQEQQGRDVEGDLDLFFQRYVNPTLYSNTEIRTLVTAERERAEASRQAAEQRRIQTDAERKAKEAEAERLKDAATRHSAKNPVAQIPSSTRTGHETTSEAGEENFEGMSASEIKKRQKARFVNT